MINKDKRVDAYISKSQEFAKPILTHLRKLIHETCPDIKETIKWGFPHFEYKGILCSTASFKNHCSFVFWKGNLLTDPHKVLTHKAGNTSMGYFGKITKLNDLPSDKILIEYIKEAMKFNEEEIKQEKNHSSKKELIVLPDLLDILNKSKEALKTFESFSYTNKKDYVDWIVEAKTNTTRLERLQTALKWLEEGKIRNWKYVKSTQ